LRIKLDTTIEYLLDEGESLSTEDAPTQSFIVSRQMDDALSKDQKNGEALGR